VNHFLLYVIEVFNFPQPPPQLFLLLFGQQIMNMPFYLPVQRPFIPTTYLYLLLHLQCQLFHFFSYLRELFFYLKFNFLLVVSVLTTLMAFNRHIHPLTSAHMDVYHFLPPCKNIHRASIRCLLLNLLSIGELQLLIPFDVIRLSLFTFSPLQKFFIS
jgi:hypothetical protein